MIQAVILMKASRNLERKVTNLTFVDEALKVEGVVDAYPTFGRFDFVVFVEADGLTDLRTTVEKVVSLPGVKGSETLVETS